MMVKKPQHKKIILVVLTTILVAAFSFVYVERSAAFAQKLAAQVGQLLSQQLQTKVTVGKVQIDSPWQLRASDLKIYDQQDHILAQVPQAELQLAIAAALHGDLGKSIKRIVLHQPQLQLVQLSPERWNYSFLLEGPPSATKFSTQLAVKDGTLNLQLWQKPALKLQAIDGDCTIADSDSIKAALSFAQGENKLFAQLDCQGKNIKIQVNAPELTVLQYLPFLPAGTLPQGLRLENGHLQDTYLELQLNGKKPLQVTGHTALKDGALQYQGFHVQGIDGFFIINRQILTLFANAKVQDQPIELDGAVKLTEKPYLSLQLSSPGIAVQALLPQAPLQGVASFRALVEGELPKPAISFTAASPTGQIANIPYRHLLLEGSSKGDTLFINKLAATVAGGKLRGQGTFSLADRSYGGSVQLQQLDLAQFGAYLPQQLDAAHGRLSLDAAFKGNLANWQETEVYGSGHLSGGSVKAIALPQASFSFGLKDGTVQLYALNAACAGGKLGLEGEIGRQRLALKVYGNNLDLAELARSENLPLSGRTTFFGYLGGTLQDPYLKLELGASDGAIFEQPYHNLYLNAVGNLDGVRIDTFAMKDQANTVVNSASGIIGFQGSCPIDLHIVTKNADVRNLLAAAKMQLPLIGNVDNDLYLQGTLHDFTAKGKVSFHEGSYHGILITSAAGTYSYKNGLLDLQDFVLHSPFVDLDIGGTVAQNGAIDLAVQAKGIDLGNFSTELPCALKGKADFTGRVQGTIDAPSFTSVLQAPSIAVNGVALTGASGNCNYQDHRLTLENFAVTQGTGQALLSGSYDLVTQQVAGDLTAQGIDVQDLAAMAGYPNDYLKGKFNGQATLHGTLAAPMLHFAGSIQDGYLKKYPLQQMDIDLDYSDHTIKINKFYGQQDNGKVALAGTWDLQGPVNMVFSTQGLTANLLTNLFDYHVDAKGNLNAYAQIDGTAQDPKANISFEIDNGGIGTATFDKMTGLLNYGGRVLTVNQILVNKGQYKASLTGKIPLTALQDNLLQMPLDYQQLDLNLSLGNADLSILPFLSPSIDWAMGPLQGNLQIKGTLAQPYFYGSLKMENGAIKIKQLGLPIKDMSLDLVFKRDKLLLQNCSGTIGKGRYNLSGSTDLVGHAIKNYKFDLAADNLSIESKIYKGPLNLHLTLQPGQMYGRQMPCLAGDITVDNVTLGMPELPDTQDSLLPTMALDVNLNVGKNVVFYNPLLYNLDLIGKVHFGGTTDYPQPSGEIDVSRGTISYLQTTFQVQNASASFNQIGSFLPTLGLKATARMAQNKIYLALTGPADQLHFSLTSDPPMSQEEIVRLLTFQGIAADGGGVNSADITQLATIGLQLGILNQLESTVRNTLKLDEFRIIRGDGSIDGIGVASNASQNQKDNPINNNLYTVEVGKYISDKVMLKYSESIGNDQTGYGIQYYFNNNVSVLNQWDNKNGYSVFLEANLKF